jgi:hypothetical protein
MSENNHVEQLAQVIQRQNAVVRYAIYAVLLVAASFVGHKATEWLGGVKAHAEHQQDAVPAAPVVSVVQPPALPAPAATPVAGLLPAPAPSLGTMSFVVQSVGASKSGKRFLNSQANYRTPGNQTVVLEGPEFQTINLDQFKGRTVFATGTPQTYRGTPEVVVTSMASLQVR